MPGGKDKTKIRKLNELCENFVNRCEDFFSANPKIYSFKAFVEGQSPVRSSIKV